MPEDEAPIELTAEDVAEDTHDPLLPLLDGCCQTPPACVAWTVVEPASSWEDPYAALRILADWRGIPFEPPDDRPARPTPHPPGSPAKPEPLPAR
jgi:hypothetical protein